MLKTAAKYTLKIIGLLIVFAITVIVHFIFVVDDLIKKLTGKEIIKF